MPSTVEDLIWYVMCFTVTTGFPTIIVIAWKVYSLLQAVAITQATHTQWIADHEKFTTSTVEAIWAAIRKLEGRVHELAK